MSDKIDKLDEGERLEKGVEKQNIHYSNSKSSDKSTKITTNTQENVFNIVNRNYGGTMQQDNFENHVRMLKDFKQDLLALQREMKIIRDKYLKQINMMESAGFVTNITKPLKNRYQIFSSKIDDIDRQLTRYDQKIEIHIDSLYNSIARARIN